MKKKTLEIKTAKKGRKTVRKTSLSKTKPRQGDDAIITPLAAAVPSIFFTCGSLHAVPPTAAKRNGVPKINGTAAAWEVAELLPSPVVDVTASVFGTNAFDGVADNSVQFQNAINSLVATGGTLLVPGNKKYVVGNVTINSKFPIHIISDMGQHMLAGGSTNTWADFAVISPPAIGCTFIFKWERHSSIVNTGFGAGGSIRGLCIADITNTGASARTRPITTAAVWADDATHFLVDECQIQWLLGTALKIGETTFGYIRNTRFYYCGSTSSETPASRPSVELGGNDSQCYTWWERSYIEQSFETGIKSLSSPNGVMINLIHCYFETGVFSPHVDGTYAWVHAENSHFWGTLYSSLVLGMRSVVQGCDFVGAPSAGVAVIAVLTGAGLSIIEGNTFQFDPASADTFSIYTVASRVNILNNTFQKCAGIKVDGVDACIIAGNLFAQPYGNLGAGAATAWVIQNSAAGIIVKGNQITGEGVSQCGGISVAGGVVSGNEIYSMAGSAIGIKTTAANTTITNNYVSAPTPIQYANGTIADNNYGTPTTATLSSDAATVHTDRAVVTTGSLTTVAGASYTFTITDQMSATGSMLLLSLTNGENTQGIPRIASWTVANGSFTVTVRNDHASQALNGTLKIGFKIIN